MRIIHIAAGAAGMYCGACARDMMLARGLMERGHDMLIVPLYTPLRDDNPHLPAPATSAVYLGGINAWLQQVSSFFRILPPAFDRMLDNPGLLRWVSRFAVSTKAEDLGPMTVSVLSGREGLQKKELERLVDFLHSQSPPDLICLTNMLLSGIAPELKRQFHCPIVCTFQGEDSFIQAMSEPWGSRARELMASNAEFIDLFISPNESCTHRMLTFLPVPREKLCIIPIGVNVDDYNRISDTEQPVFTVGYLSAITPAKGLDILAAAVLTLLEEGREIRVKVAGKTLNDKYLHEITTMLKNSGRANSFEFYGELEFDRKREFLHDISAFCVPSRLQEARGQAWLEAMAAGLTVIGPDNGAFPEMFSEDAGKLIIPNDPLALATVLRELMDDPEEVKRYGNNAVKRAGEVYSLNKLILSTERAYLQIAGQPCPDGP